MNDSYTEALERAIRDYVAAIDCGMNCPFHRWYHIFKAVLKVKNEQTNL